MFPRIPAAPEVPEAQIAHERTFLRYEDVTQSGLLELAPVPHALGAVWRRCIAGTEANAAGRAHGMVPILARMCVETGDAPIHPSKPVDVDGRFQLAHQPGEDGGAERIFLNMWVTLTGSIGRMFGPPPAGAGERSVGGTVFAEHIFTRLFAPPEQRRVTELPPPLPSIPPAVHRGKPHGDVLALPAGAEALEPELTAAAPFVFGLSHTDSNQHVNSLVYLRIFEEAVVQRLARLGASTRVQARRAEIAYRKPCFAGDEVEIALRTYRREDGVGAVGVYRPAAEPGGRPLAYLRLELC